MREYEVNVERLIGRKVVALNGQVIGRLHEVAVEKRGSDYVVTEYLVGKYGLLERLAASGIARAILGAAGVRCSGYRVPWQVLDVTDPEKPRLCCKVGDLRPLDGSDE